MTKRIPNSEMQDVEAALVDRLSEAVDYSSFYIDTMKRVEKGEITGKKANLARGMYNFWTKELKDTVVLAAEFCKALDEEGVSRAEWRKTCPRMDAVVDKLTTLSGKQYQDPEALVQALGKVENTTDLTLSKGNPFNKPKPGSGPKR